MREFELFDRVGKKKRSAAMVLLIPVTSAPTARRVRPGQRLSQFIERPILLQSR